MLELPITLTMHGIPLELVENATLDKLLVMLEIVKRDEKNKLRGQASAVNIGMLGGDIED